MVANLDPLLERNRRFATTGKHAGLSALSRHAVFVITCFDPRVDPAHILGIDLGDAVVIRNGGGRVTNDVIFQIGLLLTMAETMLDNEPPQIEVAIIHHNKCGTQSLSDQTFRNALIERTGADDTQLAALAVNDPFSTVASDVELLRSWSGLPHWITVAGYVYDVNTGLVTPSDG